jgi:hypothetical protein
MLGKRCIDIDAEYCGQPGKGLTAQLRTLQRRRTQRVQPKTTMGSPTHMVKHIRRNLGPVNFLQPQTKRFAVRQL